MGRRDKRRKVERTARDGSAAPAPAPILAPRDGRRDAWIFAVGALLVAAFFLILKSFSLNAYAGDEHIYLYQAKLVADGFVPYRDFAMAHPPFQALLTAAVFEVAGYHFLLGRLLPIAITLAGGVGLALLARRELGAIAGVAAMAAWLLAYEPLRASSHYTGVETAVALLVFAWLAARRGHLIASAALCVCAVATRLYAIPGVLALVAVTLLGDRRRGARLAIAGAAIGGVAFAALGLWTGFGAMLHDILEYQLDKTPMAPAEIANQNWSVLFHNAVPAGLLALSLPVMLGALAAAWRQERAERSIRRRLRAAIARAAVGLPVAGAFAAILMLAILLNTDRIWMYYFVPSFPFAALAAGWLVAFWARGAVRFARARGRLAAAGITRAAAVGYAVSLAAFAAWFALCPLLERKLGYWEKETAGGGGAADRVYAWRDGALPGFLNAAVRAALWRDERVVGDRHSSFTYYLWHESRALDIVEDAVAEIRARTAPGDAIFGDSGTVPLLALLAGREIAGREVDTNIQRYRSGSADPAEMIARIDDSRTKIIFVRRRFGVAGLAELGRLLRDSYEPVRALRTAEGHLYQVFARRDGAAGGGR